MKNDVYEPSAQVAYLTAPDALEDGLRLGGAGVWRWQIDSDRLDWTRNLADVHRLAPGAFDGTLSSFQRDIHPEDAEDVWRKIRQSIESSAQFRTVYRAAPRDDDDELWIETLGGITVGPDGTRYLTGICLDVSDRVRSEQHLERRLIQQRAVARFGSYALNENDLQNVLDEAVRVAAEVLQVPLTKVLQFSESAEHLVVRAGIGWAAGVVGHGEVGTDLASQAGYTLLSAEPVIVTDLRSETRFDGPPLLHEHEVRSGISVVIPGTTERPFGVLGIHARDLRDFDRTDAEFLQSLANIVAGAARQVAAAEHKTLLLREMAHRAGNLLQLVSSIASQTFNSQPDLQLARQSFSERLSALARSNYVVARSGWGTTRFSELVEETLKPFGDKVVTSGRDVLLPAEMSFDMGLVLHELATNSVKYGTLGNDGETLRVSWSIVRRHGALPLFTFTLVDPFSSPGTPRNGSGFGSQLMTTLVERKWAGSFEVKSLPHYEVTLKIPIPG